ncbi:MAG: ribonuclease E inhibitor RraB [Thermoleophilia bacterium]|nr:ribonuclease E inhibitor RraB [Gaiellaceae bacterium]MDW8339494.1 ribonuclease E inhibitor RraB [Thermoleophilia bacterium]
MGLLDRIRDRGAPRTAAEADRLALRQLAARGADLARARHVVHVLSAADRERAEAAAEAARELGYEVAIEPPGAEGGEWTIRASGERVLAPDTVSAFRAAFERIAETTGAAYDGWEAAPRP